MSKDKRTVGTKHDTREHFDPYYKKELERQQRIQELEKCSKVAQDAYNKAKDALEKHRDPLKLLDEMIEGECQDES